MRYLYVRTDKIPELLSGKLPRRNLDPWLAWFLDDEEVDRLAVELKSMGYEVDSGTPIDLDFSGNEGEY